MIVLTSDVGARRMDRQLEDLLYDALMSGACVAILARVAIRPQHRLAWGLIGAGLVAWIAGDLYYTLVLADSGSIPYPSLSDAGYLFLYAGAFAGLTILGARRNKGSWALLTVIAGLATLWSWIVFSQVVASATGETAAVATTMAYPLGDLVLLISALLLVVGAGRRLDRSAAALALGFAVMAISDSIYAAQVATDTYASGTILDAGWPAAVIVLGRIHDRRRGLDFATQVTWIFRIADGKIAEGQACMNMDEARNAVVS